MGSVYVATLYKFLYAWLFIKMLLNVFICYVSYWSYLFLQLGILSLVIGSTQAVLQQRVLRFYALSSVHQWGYLLLAAGAGLGQGLLSFWLFISFYLWTTVLFLTGILLSFNYQGAGRVWKYITDISYLNERRSSLCISLLALSLSFAAMPPLGSFFLKTALFKALLSSCSYWVSLSAFLAMCTSTISCFFYLRFFKLVYFDALYLPKKALLFSSHLSCLWLYKLHSCRLLTKQDYFGSIFNYLHQEVSWLTSCVMYDLFILLFITMSLLVPVHGYY
jgi:NADH:ubiquinone oxidoreductase subunit 2 (subunit N)